MGGLAHGRGTNDESLAKWINSYRYSAEIIGGLEELTHLAYARTDQHKEEGDKRKQKDIVDLEALKSWFRVNKPLEQDKLFMVSLASGVKFSPEEVNVHKANEIGFEIMKSIEGQDIFTLKIKKKNLVKTFAQKSGKTKIHGKEVTLTVEKLMSRLFILANDEAKLKDAFKYELTNMNLALFEENKEMRKVNQNSLFIELDKLYEAKTSNILINSDSEHVIIDGNSLINYIKWTKQLTFSDIAQQYVEVVSLKYKNATVIFSYDNSFTPVKSLKKCDRQMEVREDLRPAMSQSEFLSVQENKINLIEIVLQKMRKNNISAKLYSTGIMAYINIIKKKLSEVSKTYVLSSDPSLLAMMMHFNFDQTYYLKLTSTPNKIYNINEMNEKLSADIKNNILLIHAFTGCELNSALFGKSKGTLLKALKKQPSLVNFTSKFYNNKSTYDEIRTGTIEIFKQLYSEGGQPIDLCDARYKGYLKTVRSNSKKAFEFKSLPPTDGSAATHGARAYFQVSQSISFIN